MSLEKANAVSTHKPAIQIVLESPAPDNKSNLTTGAFILPHDEIKHLLSKKPLRLPKRMIKRTPKK